ncbi:unnamed protein product [Closterium sp. NIES-64]|nr:unnamed protein product [Closterium sp. NIES-64]CAI5963628.1 unnamed protein product [Closterium sp. NIES-64]
MARGQPRSTPPQTNPPPADVDMTDVMNPASQDENVRPVDRTPTSNPSSTLPLLYDLDALAQIPQGEFTKDVPPAPIGEFTKPRKTSTPTDAGEAGPSSVPDGSGDQDEDDYSSASDEDDEDDPRPRRGAGPRTLEEKLRGERAFIEELLDENELEDLLHTSVPREMWKAADFVEEDMVYACVDVLVMEGMRHLKTIEAKSTLKSYTSWIYDYKRWTAKMLKKIGDKLPTAEQMRHVDEIGHWTHNNKSKDWDNEKVVKRKHIWLHGPRVTSTRLRAYIKFMRREYRIDADTNEPVRAYTVHMILGRIKACQMAARVEATLFKEKELGIMREISVVRSEVRVMVRTKNQRDLDLMRGASIREITLPDIFLYRLASTSSVNPDNQPVVMVVAARNSKTSKDARLQQSYAARHLEAELCAVGETGLWLHFVLDQIGQFHGVDLIPPVDTSTRELWYKKHLFFARNDPEQGELSAPSHQRWTRQMWKTNGVFCKRNVHAARAGGAQELAIQGTPRAEIAELGHWALDKMTRAYITSIPVGVVMKKAGYSGFTQDYFLGRSRVEPGDELLALIAEHIFPDVDDLLNKAEELAKKGSDADVAAVHFWRTLLMFRRIVAEDLAVKLVRTPWHPYIQYSKLCRIPLFQHWAKRVEKTDTDTIKKRQDPTLIQPEEISVRHDAQFAVVSLTETLKLERERSTVQKLDLEEKIENRDATIASLAAEITRLTEALRVSEARRMPEAPPAANDQSPSDGGSAESASRGGGANKPNKPPQTVEEASYELNVVQPWRTATTVKDAWRLWTSCTSADTRRLCDRFREPGFVDRHTLLDGASQGAHGKRVRRMMKVIDAVRQLRRSDGEADTEATVDALNKIAAPGIGTFADALTVLNADAVATYAGQGKGVKGLGKTEFSKLRVACAFVARGLKPETWVADLFPDTWVEQMKKTLADLARENDAGQLPPTNKSTKRKKTA